MSRKYPDGWAKYAVKEGPYPKKKKQKKKPLPYKIGHGRDERSYIFRRKYVIKVGDRVKHISYGRGTVKERSEDRILILFDGGKEILFKESYSFEKGLLCKEVDCTSV